MLIFDFVICIQLIAPSGILRAVLLVLQTQVGVFEVFVQLVVAGARLKQVLHLALNFCDFSAHGAHQTDWSGGSWAFNFDYLLALTVFLGWEVVFFLASRFVLLDVVLDEQFCDSAEVLLLLAYDSVAVVFVDSVL